MSGTGTVYWSAFRYKKTKTSHLTIIPQVRIGYEMIDSYNDGYNHSHIQQA